MKVINAYWEIRNSGLPTCEILFENGDSIDDYLKANVEKNFKYSVAKISTENLILLHKLEEIGYSYIETQFNIRVSISEINHLNERWERVITGTGYNKLKSPQEMELILVNVRKGMFDNDRIAMDEKLGKVTSARRYVNWITDLFYEKDTETYFLTKKGINIGFFILRKNEKGYLHSVIAGIFNDFKGRGLSVAIIYHYLKIALERKSQYVFTSFSSNNIAMLNSFTKTVSFKTLNIFYVLRKFIDGN